jgi:hypothetical protein
MWSVRYCSNPAASCRDPDCPFVYHQNTRILVTFDNFDEENVR